MDFKNFVVVGNTINEEKYACKIKNKLIAANYNVECVGKELKSINDVNMDIDVLDLCINPNLGINLLKENLNNDEGERAYNTFKYLYNFLQVMDDVEELRYVLAYFAKSNGFVSTKEFTFNEEKQTIFEGIMYQAITLFNNGGFSKAKVIETHKKFEAEVEQRNEEKLSRTQELYTVKAQALKELGYTEINEKNAQEVLEKIAEIQTRKV